MNLAFAAIQNAPTAGYCGCSFQWESDMLNPLTKITTITDKVMRMIKAMVYLALRVAYRRGATAPDIAEFLKTWAPSESALFHPGIIERVLFDLQADGKVTHAGARWYLVGAPG
jgi:hypothetical protein